MGVLMTVWVAGQHYWRRRMNRKYYEAIRLVKEEFVPRQPKATSRSRLKPELTAARVLPASRSAPGKLVVKLHPTPTPPPSPPDVSSSAAATTFGRRHPRSLVIRNSKVGVLQTEPEATDAAVDEEFEYVEEEEVVEVEVPKFTPLPGLLVFPNLPILAFWLFNSGLVKNAVAVLSWQVVHRGSQTEPVVAQCGIGCTVVAASVLAAVGTMLLIGLAMLLHFYVRFREKCWKPTAAKARAKEVGDPCFRLWSQIKMGCVAASCWQPRKPTQEQIHATFLKYELVDGYV